jgi:hypothetical protein
MVVWYRDPMVRRSVGFQNDMTTDLMNFCVLPLLTEEGDLPLAGDVARNLHATSRTSSRTRCRRIRSGFGRSKKKAGVASSTFRRNSSHESPSVKNAFREALGAVPAIKLLDHLEDQFRHMIRRRVAGARSITPLAAIRCGLLTISRPGCVDTGLRAKAKPHMGRYGAAAFDLLQRTCL